MPAQTPLDATSLPCGADVDLLLEQAAQGRGADWDAHQRLCVRCQAALGEFTALLAPVAELAATPVAAPPGLAAAVMSQVREVAAITEKAAFGQRHQHAAVGVLGRTAVVVDDFLDSDDGH